MLYLFKHTLKREAEAGIVAQKADARYSAGYLRPSSAPGPPAEDLIARDERLCLKTDCGFKGGVRKRRLHLLEGTQLLV